MNFAADLLALLSNAARPLTGKVTPAQADMVAMGRPIHTSEHIVQAWQALAAMTRGEKQTENLCFACRRADDAKTMLYLLRAKPRKLAQARQEIDSLAAVLTWASDHQVAA